MSRPRSTGSLLDTGETSAWLTYDLDNDTRTSFHQTRHLVLDFTLVDEHGMSRNPTMDEFEKLNSVLPPNLGKGVIGGFLVVHFVELPPKPWPISVAGLPHFMTTDMFVIPWSMGPGRPHRHELEHLDARWMIC